MAAYDTFGFSFIFNLFTSQSLMNLNTGITAIMMLICLLGASLSMLFVFILILNLILLSILSGFYLSTMRFKDKSAIASIFSPILC